MNEHEIDALNEQLRKSQAEYEALPKAECGHPLEMNEGDGCELCYHEWFMKAYTGPAIRRYLAARRKQ